MDWLKMTLFNYWKTDGGTIFVCCNRINGCVDRSYAGLLTGGLVFLSSLSRSSSTSSDQHETKIEDSSSKRIRRFVETDTYCLIFHTNNRWFMVDNRSCYGIYHSKRYRCVRHNRRNYLCCQCRYCSDTRNHYHITPRKWFIER